MGSPEFWVIVTLLLGSIARQEVIKHKLSRHLPEGPQEESLTQRIKRHSDDIRKLSTSSVIGNIPLEKLEEYKQMNDTLILLKKRKKVGTT